ncbi:MAG: hypothetical protein HYZ28_08425 [Myxococcales bacterium]|nr:hypothetical protein [Myxococcales bacterium]
MTDSERFQVVLRELGELMLELFAVGLADDVVLIGAQVVALEQRSRNEPEFQLDLPAGPRVLRPFSLEPDIVLDTEDLARLEDLPGALRRKGFERSLTPGKPSRWTKRVGDFAMEIDLFTTADCDEAALPTPMTRLRGAPRLPLRQLSLDGTNTIRVPNAYAFMSLKLEAKLRIRPQHTKDSLDLFAYARVVGAESINEALDAEGDEGARVRRELRQLFATVDSDGVRDVVTAAGETMGPDEKALLARGVVDAFEPIVSPLGSS